MTSIPAPVWYALQVSINDCSYLMPAPSPAKLVQVNANGDLLLQFQLARLVLDSSIVIESRNLDQAAANLIHDLAI